MPYLKQCFC